MKGHDMTTRIFKGATVIDGTGADPAVGVVVVEGEKIAFVGRESDVAADVSARAEVFDVAGKYLTPGLMNHHEHLDNRRQRTPFQFRAGLPPVTLALRGIRNAVLSLVEGVTTIRDLGGKGQSGIHLRDAVNDGQFPGPRIFACGSPLAMTAGHAWQICRIADGVGEVRRAAREQLRLGADFVKLMASGGFVTQGSDEPTSPQYSLEELRAAIEEAHDANRLTTVHAHPPVAIRRSIEAGVDCIEHAALLDQPTAELMAAKGVFLVPTISESWIMGYRGKEMGRPQWLIDASKSHLEERLGHYSHAVRAGVKLSVGTDVIGEMVDEMRLMAAGGLSNMQVIQAATRNGAELIGRLDDLGTVETGKLADFIVVDEDPLKDLGAFGDVRYTVKGGAVYEIAELLRHANIHYEKPNFLQPHELALKA